MKKTLFIVMMSLAVAGTAQAQTKSVKQAERIAKDSKPDYAQAREIILPTLTNEESMNDPRTWYVAGLIEEKFVEEIKIKMALGNPVDEVAFYNSLATMFPYYAKADHLDGLPNAKGKVKRTFRKQLFKAMSENHGFLINAGIYYFDKQEFANAHKYFRQYLEAKELPVFEGTPFAVADSASMQIAFFSAYSASQMPNNLKNAIAEYESIKGVDYRRSDVYQLLASAYNELGDSVQYINTLQEGTTLFPNEKYFLYNLIHTYIGRGENEKGKAFLEQAIAGDPTNKHLYNVLASVYEQGFKDNDKARAAYEKALEIDPSYAEAVIGLGRLHYNQAVEIQSEANGLTDMVKYRAMDAKAKELFKKALPFFEKAVQLEPESTEYKMALRGIYYNLDMNEKMAEIEKELGM